MPYKIELFGEIAVRLYAMSIETYFKTPEEFAKAAKVWIPFNYIPDNSIFADND